MALKINVTWPRHLPQICIPIDCSDLESISRKAVKSGDHIVIDGAFGHGNRVCDDDRYRIDNQSSDPLKCCERGAAYEQTLVILLESPHKDEYLFNCIDRPIAPAIGETGENIRKYFMSVIRSCCHIHSHLVQKTRVILANPIQFQCSLVSVINSDAESDAWKETRDAVWKGLWSRQAIQNEFRERLERYHPDFIINACTHDLGCNYKCLDEDSECRVRQIHNFLAENLPYAYIYATAHPASAHWKRKKKKKDFLRLVQERRQIRPGASTGTDGGQG